MARPKKQKEVPLMTPEEIEKDVNEFTEAFGIDETEKAELIDKIEAKKTPAPEIDEPIAKELEGLWKKVSPGSGIFENVANGKERIIKNMSNAKANADGHYTFNGYLRDGKAIVWRLIKKK